MSETILKSRIIHKNDSEENFKKATGFIPKKGELVVFNPDTNNPNPRVKIGDGEHNINDLNFITDGLLSYSTAQELTAEQRAQARENIAVVQFDWRKVPLSPFTITVADGGAAYGITSFDMDGAINQSSVAYSKWCSIGAMANYGDSISNSTTTSAVQNNAKKIVQDYESLKSLGITSGTMYVCTKGGTFDELTCMFGISARAGTTYGISYTHTMSFIAGKRIGNVFYNINTGECANNLTMPPKSDDTLSNKGSAADAKAVGDALALKADVSHNHDDVYYTEDEINQKLEDINIKSKPKNVVATISGTSVTGWTCDKTFAELWEAYEDGATVMFDIPATTVAGLVAYFAKDTPISSTQKEDRIYFEYRFGANFKQWIMRPDNSITEEAISLPTTSQIVKINQGKNKAGQHLVVGDDGRVTTVDAAHDHDDRYYTEAEIDEKLKNLNIEGGVQQANWDQNDETADDYVKNRTHYVRSSEEIGLVFQNNALPFDTTSNGFGDTVEFLDDTTYIYTFKVIWDGVEYLCDRTSFSSGLYVMMPTLILGNMYLDGGYGPDTGEPFLIMVDETTGYMRINTNQTGATHSLQIVGLYEDVKQLSEKYIPDTIVRTSEIRDVLEYMYEEVSNKAYQEDLDAVKDLVGDTPVAEQINEAIAESQQFDIATDEDIFIMVTELDIVTPVADEDNNIYISDEDETYIL